MHFEQGSIRVTNCWHVVISETRDVTKPGAPAPNMTRTNRKPQRKGLAMLLAVKRLPPAPGPIVSPIDRDIRDFLAGKTDGEDLLHALYDHILDEPIPDRLRA